MLAVYQKPEYPIPGKSYAHPPGLLFEVCADGSVYRTSNSGPELGKVNSSALLEFKNEMDKEWLRPLRAECTAKGVIPDSASLQFKPVSGGTFICSLYQEGDALKQFRSRIAALRLHEAITTNARREGICK